MASLLSSQARLTDPVTISLFKRVFVQHGASSRVTPVAGSADLTQEERLAVVPLVFGLMPAAALDRRQYAQAIRLKPLIRSHLSSIGLRPDDDDLVDILQNVIYHYTTTMDFPNRTAIKKKSIGEVRATAPRLYREIKARQANRCATCGLLFSDLKQETLDHVIPWRLVGDPSSGANWQFLCRPCNLGKQHWLSAIQDSDSNNWWYGCPEERLTESAVSHETRFVVLAQRPKCDVRGCGLGPRDTHLLLERQTATGLAVADNLRVVLSTLSS
jgi:5-methylcytosine-specific restriction endonuclease McrA